jgi:hypothetical protein
MGLFRRSHASKVSATVDETGAAPMTVICEVSSLTKPIVGEESQAYRDDASDVFVCKRQPEVVAETDPSVTLIVTGWHNVEPGPLAWAFPSMRSALDAVQKMKNAIEWTIVLGRDYATVEEARALGAVLIEQRS